MQLTVEEKYKARQQAEARANGNPLPGPLAEAFSSTHIECGGFKIRPIVAYDWVLLLTIKHPLYDIVEEIKQTGKFPDQLNWSRKQEWELAYIFTRPCSDVDEIMEQGISVFEKAAKEEIAMMVPVPEAITVLCSHVLKQVVSSWKTFPNFQPKEAKEDDRPFTEESHRIPATG